MENRSERLEKVLKKVLSILVVIGIIISGCSQKNDSEQYQVRRLVYTYSSWGCLLEFVELNFETMEASVLGEVEFTKACEQPLSDDYIYYDMYKIKKLEKLDSYISELKDSIVVKKTDEVEPTDMPYWSFSLEMKNGEKIYYSETVFYEKTQIDMIMREVDGYFK